MRAHYEKSGWVAAVAQVAARRLASPGALHNTESPFYRKQFSTLANCGDSQIDDSSMYINEPYLIENPHLAGSGYCIK